jgi:A/G-specific adenine glycosylase
MLQQTQVDRVVGYYTPFWRRFRRRRLRPAPARVKWCACGRGWATTAGPQPAPGGGGMAEQHGGSVPETSVPARACPASGPYTARAVLSFAFEADVAPVDTNVVRVLARCVAGTGLHAARGAVVADRLLPAGHSWEFNQAMFDLGATVCTAHVPPVVDAPCAAAVPMAARRLDRSRPVAGQPDGAPSGPLRRLGPPGPGPARRRAAAAPCTAGQLAPACGWPDDPARAERIAAALVAEGFATWTGGSAPPLLRLRVS